MKKDKLKSILIISVSVLVIIVILLIILKPQILQSAKEPTINYLNYVIEDEDYLKQNCPYIRVGRCDKIGESFGKSCWIRPTALNFEISGISYRDLTCDVYLDSKNIEKTFEKSEKNYAITMDLDIRKINDISLCCYDLENNNHCVSNISVNAIC